MNIVKWRQTPSGKAAVYIWTDTPTDIATRTPDSASQHGVELCGTLCMLYPTCHPEISPNITPLAD